MWRPRTRSRMVSCPGLGADSLLYTDKTGFRDRVGLQVFPGTLSDAIFYLVVARLTSVIGALGWYF
jgi:hypothetical protein